MRIAIAAALFGTVVAGPAQAQFQQPAYGTTQSGAPTDMSTGYPSWDQARVGHYRRTLEAVRSEALQLQEADGGRLTATHIGYLQGRIDAAGRELAYETSGRSVSMLARSAPR